MLYIFHPLSNVGLPKHLFYCYHIALSSMIDIIFRYYILKDDKMIKIGQFAKYYKEWWGDKNPWGLNYGIELED